tara:strand:- start:287 stop:547 length:261 start_codon:yes stop_codon:yes gene_type:complete
MKNIDPQIYNLSSKTQLQQNSSGDIYVVIDRKTRIIMKDGHRILTIACKIRLVEKQNTISVLTSAPVCSKTKLFLEKHKINIRELL